MDRAKINIRTKFTEYNKHLIESNFLSIVETGQALCLPENVMGV